MTIPYHPLAELFPLMEGAAFEELVADIKTNGLVHPLTVCDGMLLEGRNRLRACEEAGVAPTYSTQGCGADQGVDKNLAKAGPRKG